MITKSQAYQLSQLFHNHVSGMVAIEIMGEIWDDEEYDEHLRVADRAYDEFFELLNSLTEGN